MADAQKEPLNLDPRPWAMGNDRGSRRWYPEMRFDPRPEFEQDRMKYGDQS